MEWIEDHLAEGTRSDNGHSGNGRVEEPALPTAFAAGESEGDARPGSTEPVSDLIARLQAEVRVTWADRVAR